MSQSVSFQTPSVVLLPDGRMDRKNAAIYLGLSAKTLAIMATEGTGPRFTKPSGRIWYRKNDLDDWLSRGSASSTSQARHLASAEANDAS